MKNFLTIFSTLSMLSGTSFATDCESSTIPPSNESKVFSTPEDTAQTSSQDAAPTKNMGTFVGDYFQLKKISPIKKLDDPYLSGTF